MASDGEDKSININENNYFERYFVALTNFQYDKAKNYLVIRFKIFVSCMKLNQIEENYIFSFNI
jgi:hypothetical protein